MCAKPLNGRSLLPRWEPIQDPTLPAVRVKTGLSSVDLTQPEALSPSVPGMFLVDLEYFFLKLGGGFDEMLFSSYYGQENVELAVRVWVRSDSIILSVCECYKMTCLFSSDSSVEVSWCANLAHGSLIKRRTCLKIR